MEAIQTWPQAFAVAIVAICITVVIVAFFRAVAR